MIFQKIQMIQEVFYIFVHNVYNSQIKQWKYQKKHLKET